MKQADRRSKRGIDRMERMGNQKKKSKERRRELAIGRQGLEKGGRGVENMRSALVGTT